MDVLLMVLGAILLVIGSNAKPEVQGVARTVGWFALIIGIVWFTISFIQGCSIAGSGYGYY